MPRVGLFWKYRPLLEDWAMPIQPGRSLSLSLSLFLSVPVSVCLYHCLGLSVDISLSLSVCLSLSGCLSLSLPLSLSSPRVHERQLGLTRRNDSNRLRRTLTSSAITLPLGQTGSQVVTGVLSCRVFLAFRRFYLRGTDNSHWYCQFILKSFTDKLGVICPSEISAGRRRSCAIATRPSWPPLGSPHKTAAGVPAAAMAMIK